MRSKNFAGITWLKISTFRMTELASYAKVSPLIVLHKPVDSPPGLQGLHPGTHMKRFLALLAVAFIVAGCNKGGTNQNSTDMRALNAIVDAEALDVLVDADVKFAAVAPNTATSYSNFSS